MERRCSPCDIAVSLGVANKICKKVKGKKTCKTIFDPIFDNDKPPSIKKTKQIVNKIKKMAKNKKDVDALNEVIRFLG